MTSDLDIFRVANFMLKQHGDKAPIHAAMRANDMLAKGADGHTVWMRIAKAVVDLLSNEPDDQAPNA